MMRSLLLLSLCLLSAHAFAPPRFVVGKASFVSPLPMSSDDDEQQQRDERLAQLGYSNDEIERSARPTSTDTPNKVKVEVTEWDIDPLTLTALGFGAIACNFFIFANMGDGGVGGIVATIMNKWDN
eukprot:CAMPEP_0119013180 /NCGR_PEP_ID=MMETSP1176-20130426/8100_1 /TAXON_ID=265551 /ORGANISM="Synedropsis recta cf, Strain CCMP1620" /LENGTH=125 /DNA_ID=CAMNT_0006966239 /DNA_START=29 /DNA_END=406 /DNA_ORIENTATION=-